MTSSQDGNIGTFGEPRWAQHAADVVLVAELCVGYVHRCILATGGAGSDILWKLYARDERLKRMRIGLKRQIYARESSCVCLAYCVSTPFNFPPLAPTSSSGGSSTPKHSKIPPGTKRVRLFSWPAARVGVTYRPFLISRSNRPTKTRCYPLLLIRAQEV